MADHKHGEMDITVQSQTFDGFMKWMSWSAVILVVLTILMAIFLI